MTIHSFSGCNLLLDAQRLHSLLSGLKAQKSSFPLQHCRDALIAALAGQIEGLPACKRLANAVCQKCTCRTAEIRRTLRQNPFRRFRIMNPIAKQSQAQKDISSKHLQTAYPPWKHDRKFARPEIHASRLLPSHHQSSLHPLPFAETQCIRQLIAALYHLRRRNLYQYRGNLLLPHALPPEPPTGRSCRFLSDSHIIRSLICQRREKF